LLVESEELPGVFMLFAQLTQDLARIRRVLVGKPCFPYGPVW
jgi:hypothetical protein